MEFQKELGNTSTKLLVTHLIRTLRTKGVEQVV